jgi:hypothetical protein
VACRCLDWTERRYHLAGPLGSQLLSRMLERRWLQQLPDTRALKLTPSGQRRLRYKLGIPGGRQDLTRDVQMSRQPPSPNRDPLYPTGAISMGASSPTDLRCRSEPASPSQLPTWRLTSRTVDHAAAAAASEEGRSRGATKMSRRMICGTPDQPPQRRRFRISNLLGDLLEW